MSALVVPGSPVWSNQALKQTLDRVLSRNVYVTADHVKESPTLKSLALYVIEMHAAPYSTIFQDIQLKCWNDVSLTDKQIAACFRVFVQEVTDMISHLRQSQRDRVPMASNLPDARLATLMSAFSGVDLYAGQSDEIIALIAAETQLPAALVRQAYEASLDQRQDPYYIEIQDAPLEPPQDVLRSSVTPGTYTIRVPGSPDRTIRLEVPPDHWGKPAGTLIAAYLSGPDNVRDYTSFAFVLPSGQIKPFKSNTAPTASHLALEALLTMPVIGQVQAGEAWALQSGRCYICRRKLTRISSISQGIGPTCAEKWGIERRLAESGAQPITSPLPAPRLADEEDLFEYGEEDEMGGLPPAETVLRPGGQLAEDIAAFNAEVDQGLRVYARRHKVRVS